jgi:hypothetical protein
MKMAELKNRNRQLEYEQQALAARERMSGMESLAKGRMETAASMELKKALLQGNRETEMMKIKAINDEREAQLRYKSEEGRKVQRIKAWDGIYNSEWRVPVVGPNGATTYERVPLGQAITMGNPDAINTFIAKASSIATNIPSNITLEIDGLMNSKDPKHAQFKNPASLRDFLYQAYGDVLGGETINAILIHRFGKEGFNFVSQSGELSPTQQPTQPQNPYGGMF